MSTVGYPETLQAGRSTAALWVLAVRKRPGRVSAVGRSKALDNQAREWLFDKADVLTWAAQRDTDTEDIEQAKLRKLIAEASREELKLAVERKEVVEVEEVLSVVETEYANVRAKLLSLPTKAAPLVTGLSDIVEVQEVLEQQINEVLEELSTQ